MPRTASVTVISLRLAMMLYLTAGVTSCAHLPRSAFAKVRQADYLASHRELPPSITNAIDNGHVMLGMDREQVWVVLGEPARKTRFDRTGMEIWLYPGHRLHQEQLHSHGADLFRLVFINGRLVVIEPI